MTIKSTVSKEPCKKKPELTTPRLMSCSNGEVVLVTRITNGRQYGFVVARPSDRKIGFQGTYWTSLVDFTGSLCLENSDKT